jgi:hypothetical protein
MVRIRDLLIKPSGKGAERAQTEPTGYGYRANKFASTLADEAMQHW